MDKDKDKDKGKRRRRWLCYGAGYTEIDYVIDEEEGKAAQTPDEVQAGNEAWEREKWAMAMRAGMSPTEAILAITTMDESVS